MAGDGGISRDIHRAVLEWQQTASRRQILRWFVFRNLNLRVPGDRVRGLQVDRGLAFDSASAAAPVLASEPARLRKTPQRNSRRTGHQRGSALVGAEPYRIRNRPGTGAQD